MYDADIQHDMRLSVQFQHYDHLQRAISVSFTLQCTFKAYHTCI